MRVERNVLILGCGRSGTSIFGELFDAFPSFAYLEEPYVDEIPTRPVGPIAVKVPRLPDGLSAPAGCALPDDLLAEVPGEPRTIFWQVRHPFDAVCSLRVGIADGWGHHPRPPDWQEWLTRPLVDRCAHHWATINGAGYRQVAQAAIVNRFEEMIQNPLDVALRTASIVGLDSGAAHEAIVAWADRVRDENDDRFAEARMSRKRSRADHTRRVGRWRENLTPDDCDRVRPIVADAAASFGYSIDG